MTQTHRLKRLRFQLQYFRPHLPRRFPQCPRMIDSRRNCHPCGIGPLIAKRAQSTEQPKVLLTAGAADKVQRHPTIQLALGWFRNRVADNLFSPLFFCAWCDATKVRLDSGRQARIVAGHVTPFAGCWVPTQLFHFTSQVRVDQPYQIRAQGITRALIPI
jgi:hypothetical protein